MSVKTQSGQHMRKPNFGANKAAAFFWDHAGYSWSAETETPEEGRKRCALRMAEAEAWAASENVRFEWREDDQTDASFRKTSDPYVLWVCLAFHATNDEESPACVASCGGIDLGRGGYSCTDPYVRVMEAELALEAMPND